VSNDASEPGGPIEINSCDDVLSHVFEFLDHETDDARRALIAEHLDDCSGCLRERIKLQLTSVSFEDDGTQVSVVRVEHTEERPAT
jgi:hypothetical protein